MKQKRLNREQSCSLGYVVVGWQDMLYEDGGHLASGNHGEGCLEHHSLLSFYKNYFKEKKKKKTKLQNKVIGE